MALRGSWSTDGRRLVYERSTRWDVEWRNYRGGQNTPLTILEPSSLDETLLPNERTSDTYAAETTPLKVGDTIYLCTPKNILIAVDAETGRPLWTEEIKGEAWASPLVADGKVYLGTRSGSFYVFASNKEKKVLSETMVDGRKQDGPNLGAPVYSTPVAANGVIYISSNTHLFALYDSSKLTPAGDQPPRINLDDKKPDANK